MPDALSNVSTRRKTTPQTVRAEPTQVVNSAGGYTFPVSQQTRVMRFLTLGVEGGTYYTTEAELTRDNARVMLEAAARHTSWLVDRIVDVSLSGRAPRQNPALFALAACASLADELEGRRKALAAITDVCRTGSQLFTFIAYAQQFRGWGRGLRNGISAWYEQRDVDQLAYQLVKYRQREGWTHCDVLRQAHPHVSDLGRRALISWAAGKDLDPTAVPSIVNRFIAAQETTNVPTWANLASEGLPWEALPDAALNEPLVWEAMIARGMPATALMRQLPRLTRLGVLAQSSPTTKTVAAQLQNPERLKAARVHPVNVLIAQRTYASGKSLRGSSTWTPVRQIVDALDAGFYAAYGTIEPTGRPTMLALDVSGSMASGSVGGLPMTPREASAALALVQMSIEPDTHVVGFTGGGRSYWERSSQRQNVDALTELAISPRQRLDDAVRTVSDLPFGSTDCALPMLYAAHKQLDVDTFVIYTDNETWAGAIHPHQALDAYRQRSGRDARLAVVGLTATNFTIADPADPGQLDVAGFDSHVPQLLTDFGNRLI